MPSISLSSSRTSDSNLDPSNSILQISCELISSFALLCGIGSGGFFALQSSVVAQVIGLHRLERGIGWLELAASFGFLAGPISAGALLDAFGGTTQGAAPYRPVIVSLSSKFLGSAIEIGRKSG
jgi:MFS family permease